MNAGLRTKVLAGPVDFRRLERHSVAMELRFFYRSAGVTYIGSGRTRNVSSETICFEADQGLSESGELELHIRWPDRLNRICPLELVVKGSLVRMEGSLAVLRMKYYEFRTQGERSFSQAASWGITCDVTA